MAGGTCGKPQKEASAHKSSQMTATTRNQEEKIPKSGDVFSSHVLLLLFMSYVYWISLRNVFLLHVFPMSYRHRVGVTTYGGGAG